MFIRRSIIIITAVISVMMLPGCARFPDAPTVFGRQLVITFRVRGRISPIDPIDPSLRRYYFIAIDNDNNPNTGPWAAAFPPFGGTGWVTSQFASRSIGMTSYIEYDAQNLEGYIYNVLPGSFFLNTTSPQPPIDYDILEGGSALRFVIDFSQIATTAIPAPDITQLDINIITTNELAINPDYNYPDREWDGIGPSGQDYVTIDTANNGTYRDDDIDSCAITDPDLDIISWEIEIQNVASR